MYRFYHITVPHSFDTFPLKSFCLGNMHERTELVFWGKLAKYMHDYNVNGIREVVSFELGKEIEKDVFCLVSSVEQRKHSESP